MPADGVVIEGDGALKYDRVGDASSVVAAEKERERWIREQDYGLARYNFAVARYQRSVIVDRAMQANRLRGALPVPANWSLAPPPWVPVRATAPDRPPP